MFAGYKIFEVFKKEMGKGREGYGKRNKANRGRGWGGWPAEKENKRR